MKPANTREWFKMERDTGSEEEGQPLKPVKKMVEGEQSLKMVEEVSSQLYPGATKPENLQPAAMLFVIETSKQDAGLSFM